MDSDVAKVLGIIDTFEKLRTFEDNARRQNRLSPENKAGINQRAAELGRALVVKKTGLDLSDLSSAEESIVDALSAYVGIKTAQGSHSQRTLNQIKNRGLIGAAEAAVVGSKPTMGYATLEEAGRGDLSYEQIVVNNPDEFTDRAQWYARRTLGLPTESDRPPASGIAPVQRQTEEILFWLKERAAAGSGNLGQYTNADAARALSMNDMSKHGRPFGNLQSRVDFACYKVGLSPLGLAADVPFDNAWGQGDRDWAFPVESMQRAAKSRRWRPRDFNRILAETRKLPGRAYIAWKQELSTNGAAVREWAYGLEDLGGESEELADRNTNPIWNRDEHVLALDLYMRFRKHPLAKNSEEVVNLSDTLRALAARSGVHGTDTFRNSNGVYMKLMNFRRLDPEYTSDGRVGLAAGNKMEETVWKEFSDDPESLSAEVERILAKLASDDVFTIARAVESEQYWVFVCNPKKWAIDRFLESGVEEDSWGIRPSDQDRFAPGQLGVVRVGVDHRTIAERESKPALEPGIYALCEVLSTAYPGTGANDGYWSEGAHREPGWPTVRIKYLRRYQANALTIARLRTERPNLSHMLLNGFQAASFPISAQDFHTVTLLLGEDLEAMEPARGDGASTLDGLAALEKRFANASPEVKTRVSKSVERGPIGSAVKRANGYKCQLCQAMGLNPVGFLKRDGNPYVEAHHVMLVSTKSAGILSATNIMTLCANHHRQVHYGKVSVTITETSFEIVVDEMEFTIPKVALPEQSDAEQGVRAKASAG